MYLSGEFNISEVVLFIFVFNLCEEVRLKIVFYCFVLKCSRCLKGVLLEVYELVGELEYFCK